MLIRCPECGKEISDKTEACIHCGYPIKALADEKVEIATKSETEEQLAEISLNKAQLSADISKDDSAPRKITSKRVVAIAIAIAAVVIMAIITVSGGTLNPTEEYVYRSVSKYRNMLKDPDSLVIRGDILYVVNVDGDKYVIFSSSGNNSYGAKVTSMPIFMNNTYIGEYGDDPDDLDDLHDKLYLARGQLIVSTWNLIGSGMAGGKDYSEAELISGKKIASKVHCDWKEE